MTFKHKIVRDLQWAMASPSIYSARALSLLTDEFCQELTNDCGPWLIGVDADPQHLKEWILSRPQHSRLGLYFALLLEYWLRFCPSLAVGSELVVGRQIKKARGQGTKGQLKFMFKSDRFSPDPAAVQHLVRPSDEITK